jgi:hypothetical protein
MAYREPGVDREQDEDDRREVEALLAGVRRRRRTMLVALGALGAALVVAGVVFLPHTRKSPEAREVLHDPGEDVCTRSGGRVAHRNCCAGDYPGTCAPGAFGCNPRVQVPCLVCECGQGRCFDVDAGCVGESP